MKLWLGTHEYDARLAQLDGIEPPARQQALTP